MKQPYEKADAEVVLFDNSDIITTSGGTSSENYYCISGYDKPGSGCQNGSHDGQVM